jgi:D-alanyl-D-alanine carboxypeptidase
MQHLFYIRKNSIEGEVWSERKSGKLRIALLFTIFVVGPVFIFTRLTMPKYDHETQDMEHLVTDIVNANKLIKNCVLCVAKGDGSFIWSGAAGIANQAGKIPMTKDTPIYLASITKIYVATIIMKLYEQDSIHLDDEISKYLPEELIQGLNVYQGHDYSREITIEQLLSQTSGIPDYYDEKGKDGKTLFEIFKNDQDRHWTVEDQVARVKSDLVSRSMPGQTASYSDTNYQLLGKIIESITGKPLQNVLSEFLFIPLNLKHTWLTGNTAVQEVSIVADVFSGEENIAKMRSSSFYWADGGLVSTVEDEVIFLKALKEGRIIKPATLEMMHHWNPIKNTGPFDYGFGTMEIKVLPAPDILPVWGHSGSTGSFLYYSPVKDLYVAGSINQTNENQTAIFWMLKAMQTIARTDKFNAAAKASGILGIVDFPGEFSEDRRSLPSTLKSTGIRSFGKNCFGIISSKIDLDKNEIHWECSDCTKSGNITGI